MLLGSIVVIGLFFSILLGASQKLGHSGSIGLLFGALSLPAGISLLWRSSYIFGWWTIAIFLGISFAVGPIVQAARRSEEGLKTLILTQPLMGIIGVGCAAGCWFIK